MPRFGCLALLLALSCASCEKVNPGLALEIKLPVTVAGSLTQVAITIANAGGALPMRGAMSDLKGVTLSSDGTTATLTVDAPDFKLTDDFQLLLVPTGQTAILVRLDGRMYKDGVQVGAASATDVSVKPGARTSAVLDFKCSVPSCMPVRGLVDLSAPPSAGLVQITGDAHGDKLAPVAIGKFTANSGDGDLVLAAPAKSMGGLQRTGVVYIFKSQSWKLPGFATSQPATDAAITIIGRENDSLGSAAATGDFDGDGVDDLVVTGVTAQRPYCAPAPTNSCTHDADCTCGDFQCKCPNGMTDSCTGATGVCVARTSFAGAGVAYVFTAKRLASATKLDLNNAADYAATPRIYGAAGQEQLGSSVALAHVSAGPYTDLFLGAPGGQNAGAKVGRVYQVNGFDPTGVAELQLLLGAPGGLKAQLATVYGPTAGRPIGAAIAAGDLDGDGKAELAIGDPADGTGGTVHVVRGATLAMAPGGAVDLAVAFDAKIAGMPASQLGSSLLIAALDPTEGAGVRDLIVGARAASTAYVFSLGKALAAGTAPITLDVAQGMYAVALAGTAGSGFGASMATGNLDGDAQPDLLIGAPDGNGPDGARPGAGGAFVVLGNQLGALTSSARTISSAAVSMYGAQPMDGLGAHVQCGNLDNSSDTDEPIAGADNGDNQQGVVYALESLPSQ
jgi:hypothetical protein